MGFVFATVLTVFAVQQSVTEGWHGARGHGSVTIR
jgi:hypothetical protein